MSFDWSTAGLPNPSLDFSGQIETSVIRTKMESGRVRQRRRFTSGLRTLNVQWLFDDDEFGLFQGIYLYKIASGADWFDNLSIAVGDGIETYTARFVGDGYTHIYVPHMQWRVRAKIEIENISPLSEAEIDAILTP